MEILAKKKKGNYNNVGLRHGCSSATALILIS